MSNILSLAALFCTDSVLQNIREATELMLCNTYLKRHFIGNGWHIYVTNQPLPETNGIDPAGITDTGERQISLLTLFLIIWFMVIKTSAPKPKPASISCIKLCLKWIMQKCTQLTMIITIHDLPASGYTTSIHDQGGHGTIFVTSWTA